jgi:hypothetical protein
MGQHDGRMIRKRHHHLVHEGGEIPIEIAVIPDVGFERIVLCPLRAALATPVHRRHGEAAAPSSSITS